MTQSSIAEVGMHVQLREGQRAHVESYFLKLNDPAQGFALWLKFTFLVPRTGQAQAEAWAVWFDMKNADQTHAWKTTVPLDGQVIIQPDIHLKVASCELTARHTHGSLRDLSGKHIEWKLDFKTDEAPLRHLPWRWMYERRFPKSKILAPQPASRFSGTVSVDGHTYNVHKAVGTLGHNWGAEHAWQYAWGHCAMFKGHDDSTFFEGFSTRIKLGPFVSPLLSVAHLSLNGRRYAFNRWTSLRSRPVHIGNQRWDFRLASKHHILVGKLEAPREDFICLHYRNPDQSLAYCLNSKLANANLRLLDRQENEIAQLVSHRGAALEVLTRDPGHGVRFGA